MPQNDKGSQQSDAHQTVKPKADADQAPGTDPIKVDPPPGKGDRPPDRSSRQISGNPDRSHSRK